ncbi:MAG: hypothetical protein Q9172_007650 [Xanthocarpia lactea]
MAARYTTAGGQYHWTALLAPESMKRGLSYSCGSINAIGRIACTASIHIIVAQLFLAMIAFNIPSYNIEPQATQLRRVAQVYQRYWLGL